MRILLTAVSTKGRGDPAHEPVRRSAITQLLQRCQKEQAELLVLPAGYWAAEDQGHHDRLVEETKNLARQHGVSLLVGIDEVSGNKDSKNPKSASHSGPFPYFAVLATPSGQMHRMGPQLSIYATHGPHLPRVDMAQRLVQLKGRSIFVLLCGEMRNDACEDFASRTQADLIIDLGHSSDTYAWKGVEIFARNAGTQMLHVQHLKNTASMISSDSRGRREMHYADDTSRVSTHDGFWYGWCLLDV